MKNKQERERERKREREERERGRDRNTNRERKRYRYLHKKNFITMEVSHLKSFLTNDCTSGEMNCYNQIFKRYFYT